MGSRVSRSTSRTSAGLMSGLSSASSLMITGILQRTSFGDFGKGQARATLKIDIIGINKGAQGSQGFASEEIGFRTLSKRKQRLWLAMFVGWRGSHSASPIVGVR